MTASAGLEKLCDRRAKWRIYAHVSPKAETYERWVRTLAVYIRDDEPRFLCMEEQGRIVDLSLSDLTFDLEAWPSATP